VLILFFFYMSFQKQRKKKGRLVERVAGDADADAETAAQAEARRRAGQELRWKPLVDVWNGLLSWSKPGTGQ
jgi:hypothetical protein